MLSPCSGVFPISYANITCWPYRMWGWAAGMLFLGTLGQEEHLERGRRVHYAHSKMLLECRLGHESPRTEQGGRWWHRDRVEPPMGAGDFPGTGSKLTSLEDDILGDPETLSVVMQGNVYCGNFALNLFFCLVSPTDFLVLLTDYMGTSENPASSCEVLTCPLLFCGEGQSKLGDKAHLNIHPRTNSSHVFVATSCNLHR